MEFGKQHIVIITEKYNLAGVRACLADPECPDKDKLEKIKKNLKVNKEQDIGLLDVKLVFKNGERAYPKGGLTMSMLKKDTRAKVCVKCIDIDIVNCQPTILNFLCEKYNIKTASCLKKYVKFRKDILDDNKITKQDVISIINGGNNTKGCEFLNDLKNEMEMICERFSQIEDFKKIIKHAKTKNDVINSRNFLFYIVSDFETRLIVETKNNLENKFHQIHINSYEYDGFKIQLPNSNAVVAPEITEYLNETTKQFGISWMQKPFNENITIENNFEVNIDKDEDKDDRAVDQINADHILEIFKDKIFRTDAGLMVYDDRQGLWYSNDDEHYRIFLENYKHFIIKNEISFKSTYSSAMEIMRVSAPINDNFFNDKDIGHLLFENGVLDMYNFEMKPFSPDYRFTKKINRPYNTNREYECEIVCERLFETMITDKLKLDYFLQLLSRGLAGEYLDRQFAFLIGKTACGKGKMTKFFELACQKYIGNFNAEHLIKKSGNGESEREWSFMMNIYDCRIAFSSELQNKAENGKEIKLDAQKIKKMVSAGDRIRGRNLYKDAISVINRSFICPCVNDIVEASPADDAYMSRANYIQADRSSSNEITEDNEKFFVADNEIDEFISSIENQDALIALMCSHYANSVDERIPKPEMVKEIGNMYAGVEEQPDNWVKQNYTIVAIQSDWKTGTKLANGNDAYDWDKVGDNWISFNELYDAFKRAGNIDSKTKFGLMLNDFSTISYRKVNGKTQVVRIGIKRIQNEDD